MDKKYLNIDEQIQLLINRGLTIENKEKAKEILFNISYFSLINGYSSPFLISTSPKRFITNSTFEEIYSLYNFDKNLRSLILKYILPIEEKVKSRVINEYLSKTDSDGNFVHSDKDYLDKTSFDNSNERQAHETTKLIDDLNELIGKYSNENPYLHYINTYNYVPLFVLATRASFGTLSHFYACMKPLERKNIAKTFNVTDKEMRAMLGYLSHIRNSAAHGNRLYCFESRYVLPRSFKEQEFQIVINKFTRNSKLPSLLICFKKLLVEKEYLLFIKDFKKEVDSLVYSIKSLPKSRILEILNLYNDWEYDFYEP